MTTIDYRFGEKHIAYMRRARDSVMNVAEGAVRSGKTVDNLFVFASLLEVSPDRLHLATGSTSATAKLTLGDCNGFGLEFMFRGRCRWGRFKGCDALYVQTPTGTKTILFAGGKNADSYKRIRGLSIGMWIATEINLHHVTMIREAFSRQLAAKDRRIFWDLNPESPAAPIYRDFLDRYASMSADGSLSPSFYNYGHFTIFDNATISKEKLTDILAQYDPGSVWYRRDIEGVRCAAEGMIYPRFASDPDAFFIDREGVPPLMFATIGVDFGGNRSKTTFVACGFTTGFCEMIVLADAKLDNAYGDVCSEDVNAAFAAFLRRLHEEFPSVPIRYVFCDSEAQYLIHGLKRALSKRTDFYPKSRTNVPIANVPTVMNAKKLPIHERIACETSLFASNRLRLVRGCDLVAAGLAGAMWDASREKDVRLDNFSSDIDILDAFEYAFEGYIKKLLPP